MVRFRSSPEGRWVISTDTTVEGSVELAPVAHKVQSWIFRRRRSAAKHHALSWRASGSRVSCRIESSTRMR